MATRPSLLCNRHDAVLGPGDGPADKQQVPVCIDPDHPETNLGVPLGTHVTRHALALDDTGGVGTGTDRPRLPMTSVAVRRRTTTEAVSMNDTLKSATLGGAGHLDQLSRCENVDFDFRAGRRRLSVDAEAAEHLGRRLETGLLGMPQLCLGGALRATGPKAKLNTAIADLDDFARTSLDDRHRYGAAVFIEDAGHTKLAPDQSDAHRYSTLISTSTPAGRSSLVSASIVCGRESLMSISRLWVRSSNCSRLFLSTCGLRSTVHRSVLTGNGIGPDTCAPVFSAVRTMSAAAWSRTTWSKAFNLILIFWAISSSQSRVAGRESRSR